MLTRYNVRPRHYIFNKNDAYLRNIEQNSNQPVISQYQVTTEVKAVRKQLFIPTSEMVRLETAVTDPRAKFQFKATKGGLRVIINEIKEESV